MTEIQCDYMMTGGNTITLYSVSGNASRLIFKLLGRAPHQSLYLIRSCVLVRSLVPFCHSLCVSGVGCPCFASSASTLALVGKNKLRKWDVETNQIFFANICLHCDCGTCRNTCRNSAPEVLSRWQQCCRSPGMEQLVGRADWTLVCVHHRLQLGFLA